MKVKAVVLSLLLIAFASIFFLAFWPRSDRGSNAPAKSVKPASSDPEIDAITQAIARSFGIDPDERLARGVKRIESVSVEHGPGKKVTIVWALKNGIEFVGSGTSSFPELESGRLDILAILNGLPNCGVEYDNVRLRGTLPTVQLGSATEAVVIDAEYSGAAVQKVHEQFPFLGPHVVVDPNVLRLEKKSHRKKPADVLDFAERAWIAPDIDVSYR